MATQFSKVARSLPSSGCGTPFALDAGSLVVVDVPYAVVVWSSCLVRLKKLHKNGELTLSALIPVCVALAIAALSSRALAGPERLSFSETAPQIVDQSVGETIQPGRVEAAERNAYDVPRAAFGEPAKNFENRLVGNVSGFINGLGGFGDGMKKISGYASEVSQTGKSDQQRLLTRVFAPDTPAVDPRGELLTRAQPQVLTYARKRYVESRDEFAKFKGGLSCDVNFSKLWGGSSGSSADTVAPAPVRYGLVLREIKVTGDKERLTASDAPIDGDDLMNASKPQVVWSIGPLPREVDNGAFAVNLADDPSRGGLWQEVDWSYYRPDFAMRLMPKDGLEANTGSLPAGKPVKLVTEQKRGFYRLEMDGLDPNLVHHFFAVPLYQKLTAAYVFNKSFIEEKISLLNLLAASDRPMINLHYLPLDERVKSEVKAGVGPYAVTFGSDTSKRLADKDTKTKYEMGLTRDF